MNISTSQKFLWLIGGLAVITITMVFLIKPGNISQSATSPATGSEFQKNYEDQIKNNITGIMNQVVGKNAYHVTVQAALDENTQEIERIQYTPKKVTQSYSEKKRRPSFSSGLPALGPKQSTSVLPGFSSELSGPALSGDTPVNRSLFAYIFSTAFGLKSTSLTTTDIQDVSKDNPYYSDIKGVIESKILTLNKGKFNPKEKVEKVAVLTALLRINPLPALSNEQKSVQLPYQDVPKTHWAYGTVQKAYANKMLDNTPFFEPGKILTVNQLIAMILQSPAVKHPNKLSNLVSKQPTHMANTRKSFSTIEHKNDVIYYDQVTSRTTTPRVKISKLTISLLIDEYTFKQSNIDLGSLESLIKHASGFNTQRNDQLIVNLYPFKDSSAFAAMMKSINQSNFKWGFYTLAGLLFISVFAGGIYALYKLYQNYIHSLKETMANLRKKKEEELIIKSKEAYHKKKMAILNYTQSHPGDIANKLNMWAELG